jgi:hypothetical protein
MSINIYTQPNPSTALSQDGAFTSPFALTFDGRVGGYKEVKLFLRNSNPSFYFTDLEVSLEDNTSESITSTPENGYVWKLSYGDTKPTYNDWLNIPEANALSVTTPIGGPGNPDTSTYLPFWVFIQVPAGIDIQVFTDVKFVVTGNQVSV